MPESGKSASAAVGVDGASASDEGDRLYIDTIQPAWPQSRPELSVGEDGVLLIQAGLRVGGASAAEEV